MNLWILAYIDLVLCGILMNLILAKHVDHPISIWSTYTWVKVIISQLVLPVFSTLIIILPIDWTKERKFPWQKKH